MERTSAGGVSVASVDIGFVKSALAPYMSVAQQEKIKEWIHLGLYDSVVYPPLEQVPLKFAISKRNEWMISQSDFVIAYVEHSFGGAYQGLHYARQKGKRIVNLAE